METTKIKIAALQMESEIGHVKANHKKLINLLEQNVKKNNFDLLILPEVWTVGWECSKFINSAEEINNSGTIELLSSIAKKYSTYVLGGSFIEKEYKNYYNTCPVISPDGNLIAK